MAQEDRNGATTTPPSPPPQLQEVLDDALAAQAAAEAAAVAAAATPVAAPTNAAASKATPVDADLIPLVDSAASFILKKLTWANLKLALASLWQRQTYTAFTTAGTAPTYTLNASPDIAYVENTRLLVKIHSATSSGAATLNVDTLGAKSLKFLDATGAKVDPYLPANFYADIQYDGTDWIVLNPITPTGVRVGDSSEVLTDTGSNGTRTLVLDGVTREVQTASARTSTVDGGSVLFPEFKCRAWGNFNGTGTPAYRASGNTNGTITDNGTGDYTITFATAMPDANYSVVCSASRGTAATATVIVNTHSLTTTNFRLTFTNDAGGTVDPDVVSFAVFR